MFTHRSPPALSNSPPPPPMSLKAGSLTSVGGVRAPCWAPKPIPKVSRPPKLSSAIIPDQPVAIGGRMKISIQPHKTNRASTLLAVALLAVVVGGALATYLLIVKDESMRGFRSQNWNTSLMVAEAGVEDALALVNKYQGTTNQLTNWYATAVSLDHWTNLSGTTSYQMSRKLGSLGTYTVTIANVVSNTTLGPILVPNITSIGTVTNTFGPAAVRKVFVQTKADSNVTGGLIAETSMNFNGNNTTVDSFDSSDPSKSLWQTNLTFNGAYYGFYSSAFRTADAVVGTDGRIVQVGNANIYGYVDTGPGGGVSIQKNGSVGDLTWVPKSGVQTSPTNHLRDDMNVIFSDAVLPAPVNIWGSSWLTLPKLATTVTIGGIAYDYVITNIVGKPGTPTNQIYWQLSSMGKGDSLMVNASNVVLYLPGGITMKTGDNLSLNTNSSVSIYTGANIDTQNGAVNNSTKYALPFKIFGLPACTSISFGPNANLTAWIYAPEASVSFNGGGGGTTYDVVGSFMVHDVTLNGHYNFHFDERLKWVLPPYRFVADSWQEVH